MTSTTARSPALATGGTSEIQVGVDSNYLTSGCFFEDSIEGVSDSSTTVTRTGFAPGADIIASQAGSCGTMDRLTERFDHVWRNRRPVFTWATTSDSYVELAESSHAYRYIFDQRVGTGGVAPSATGPAITLPVPNAGQGLDNTIRVYVWALAAMSGSTDSGSLAIANKDTTGTMGSMTALHNPQTIGGTGFSWYPSLGTFDPSSTPYFESPTNLPFDRVCLGARSEGTTDKVRIRAWMMAVYPSRA